MNKNTYNTLPYQAGTQPMTHVGWLEALGKLYGLEVAGADGCRVLELGCAQGMNLLAMAQAFPQSHFEGVDLSEKQIVDGTAAIEALGLKNAVLKCGDFAQVDYHFETYDYIIAHGLFSWIPAELQTALLKKCKQLLAPNGIIYVSYNTYPGWKLHEILRDAAFFQIEQSEDTQTGASHLLSILEHYNEVQNEINGPLSSYLNCEKDILQNKTDAYISHDFLEENNNPVYYSQFVKMGDNCGLQVFGDADDGRNGMDLLEPALKKRICALTEDNTAQEQYADFFNNRSFRRTLLCHKDKTPSDGPTPAAFLGLKLVSPLQLKAASIDLENGVEAPFFGTHGERVVFDDMFSKVLFLVLSEHYPKLLDFEEVLKIIEQYFQQVGMQLGQEATISLCAIVLKSALLKHLSLFTHSPSAAPITNDKPHAPFFVRWHAEKNLSVINAYHQAVKLSESQRRILAKLDGKHDIDALAHEIKIPVETIKTDLKIIEGSALLQQ